MVIFFNRNRVISLHPGIYSNKKLKWTGSLNISVVYKFVKMWWLFLLLFFFPSFFINCLMHFSKVWRLSKGCKTYPTGYFIPVVIPPDQTCLFIVLSLVAGEPERRFCKNFPNCFGRLNFNTFLINYFDRLWKRTCHYRPSYQEPRALHFWLRRHVPRCCP